jgi:general secretion pathway protein D
MGGLVDERTETFRDQVPFLGDIPYLGRLFRTEGSRSAKKNLTIFVTATQVDVNGMTSAERELARQ